MLESLQPQEHHTTLGSRLIASLDSFRLSLSSSVNPALKVSTIKLRRFVATTRHVVDIRETGSMD